MRNVWRNGYLASLLVIGGHTLRLGDKYTVNPGEDHVTGTITALMVIEDSPYPEVSVLLDDSFAENIEGRVLRSVVKEYCKLESGEQYRYDYDAEYVAEWEADHTKGLFGCPGMLMEV